jgi:hypothetical protein
MYNKPIIYIDYICDKCGEELCATDFFIGQLKPCRRCGHAMMVPPISTQSRKDRESRQRPHEPPRQLRDEQFYAAVLELRLGATSEDVKRAYKDQLMRYHPDRVEHLGWEFQEIANQKTKLITEAYAFFFVPSMDFEMPRNAPSHARPGASGSKRDL